MLGNEKRTSRKSANDQTLKKEKKKRVQMTKMRMLRWMSGVNVKSQSQNYDFNRGTLNMVWTLMETMPMNRIYKWWELGEELEIRDLDQGCKQGYDSFQKKKERI